MIAVLGFEAHIFSVDIKSDADKESEDAVFDRIADEALACFLARHARALEARLQHPIGWASRGGA